MVANQSGAVWVRRADGTIQKFPSADNDAARGAALSGAFALGTELRNSTVFLGPGTYVIPSPLRGWNGTKLWGSGKDATLVKLADGAVDRSYWVFRTVESEDPRTGYRFSTDCELRDLTIDANRQHQLRGEFFGLGAQLLATNATMSGVRCRNAGGNVPQELFFLSCGAGGGVEGTFKTGEGKNCLIENCEIDGSAPPIDGVRSNITAIVLNGGFAPDPTVPGDGWETNGRIVDCTVHGIRDALALQAYQVSWASRVVVERCSVYDNGTNYTLGFYMDTGSLRSVSVSHNRFIDVDIGVRLICDPTSIHMDTTIFANEMRIRSLVNGSGKAGMEYDGHNRTTRTRVIGNRIFLASSFPGAVGVSLGDQAEPFLLANTIDGFGIPMSLRGTLKATVRGNTDANGIEVGRGLGNPVP